MEEREIGAGASCFLIKDERIKGSWRTTTIHKFLEDEGFICWGKAKSHEEIDWLYINIYSKVYSKGMYGVGLTKVVGNHAVTFDEFLSIYNIYKKYDGLDALNMNAKGNFIWQIVCPECGTAQKADRKNCVSCGYGFEI